MTRSSQIYSASCRKFLIDHQDKVINSLSRSVIHGTSKSTASPHKKSGMSSSGVLSGSEYQVVHRDNGVLVTTFGS
jgi:hypothetical protein